MSDKAAFYAAWRRICAARPQDVPKLGMVFDSWMTHHRGSVDNWIGHIVAHNCYWK